MSEKMSGPVFSSPDRLSLAGQEFCRVPAGKFLMGSAESDLEAYADEKPQHEVDLPYDYWLARFPVTNAQYQAFVKAGGGPHPVPGWRRIKATPVVNVSWQNAMDYCHWLNRLLQEQRRRRQDSAFDFLPSAFVFRLPSEAEWEKAARGASGGLYPWGEVFDPLRLNSRESGKVDIAPVGAIPRGASPCGCEQMMGNIWEWTHSLLDRYPYQSDDGREGEQTAGARVCRGDSFYYIRRHLRAACRFTYGPFFDKLGFRIALAPSFSG